MKLFTVTTTFSDFTEALEQYEADSPDEALEMHFKEAECFDDYDRDKLVAIIMKKIKDKKILKHLQGPRGVWIIIMGEEFLGFGDEEKGIQEIYGGWVIQTDPHGSRYSS